MANVDEHIDLSGRIIGDRYRLARPLGEGQMGQVWLAEDTRGGPERAVKLLRPELLEDRTAIGRFHREALAAVAVRHGNIVELVDVGVADWGDPFLVMEHIEGVGLRDILRRTGPVSLPVALGVVAPVLEGLAAAHAAGVAHRDLKPENIRLGRGPDGAIVVKIIDFGLAKLLGDANLTALTATGEFLGSVGYAAPELLSGAADADHRADVYAVGVLLYELLTGRGPFEAKGPGQLVMAVVTRPPTPPTEAFAGFPAELEPLVLGALAKRPEERPESAAAITAALARLPVYDRRAEALAGFVDSFGDLDAIGGDA